MPMSTDLMSETARRVQLREAAEAYFGGLARRDFDSIPYADNVVLRAPLVPGGVHAPLVGRETLRRVWWAPMENALGEIEILRHYFAEDLSGVCTAAIVGIANSPIKLRVADRFTVDADGRIVEQENHLDPRDVTNPGWRG
jgi:hypothetical protein